MDLENYNFEGGCLTGIFGYSDISSGIVTLGYSYDPNLQPPTVAEIALALGITFGYYCCCCLPCIYVFCCRDDENSENEEKYEERGNEMSRRENEIVTANYD